MQTTAIVISLKTAFWSIVATFFLGLLAALCVARMKREWVKMLVDGILTLPLVLPPTVVGFFLLFIFGNNRPVGQLLIKYFGQGIAFTWYATILAAVVVSFPLMYRAARGALEQVDPTQIYAARTLGLGEWTIFWRVALPSALPGVAGGAVLAFARGMGEFGATAMIAGNIAGKTRTLPLAVYSEVAAGRWDEAFDYVAVIVVISFLVVAWMNYFLAKEKRVRRKRADI